MNSSTDFESLKNALFVLNNELQKIEYLAESIQDSQYTSLSDLLLDCQKKANDAYQYIDFHVEGDLA